MQSFHSRRSSANRKRSSRSQVVSLGLESLEQRLLLATDGFGALNGHITAEIDDHRTLLINGTNVDDKIQLRVDKSNIDYLSIHANDSSSPQFRFNVADFDSLRISTHDGDDTITLEDREHILNEKVFQVFAGAGSDFVDLSGQNSAAGLQDELNSLWETSRRITEIAQTIRQSGSESLTGDGFGFVETVNSQIVDAAQRLSERDEMEIRSTGSKLIDRAHSNLLELADRFQNEAQKQTGEIADLAKKIDGIVERFLQITPADGEGFEGSERLFELIAKIRELAENELFDEHQDELEKLTDELELYIDDIANDGDSVSYQTNELAEELEQRGKDFVERAEREIVADAESFNRDIKKGLERPGEAFVARVERELVSVSKKIAERIEEQSSRLNEQMAGLADSLTQQAALLTHQAQAILQKHFAQSASDKSNHDFGCKPQTVNTITGDGSGNLLIGTAQSDLITGGGGNDWIIGLGAADNLQGDGGNDIILGMGGADLIRGGAGNDLLLGNDGNDCIHGDEGVDIILGNDGDDKMDGGEGLDIMLGSDGDDEMHGGDDIDVMFGNDGKDTMHGDDDIDFMWGSAGDDTMYGGDGRDVTGISTVTIHVGNLMFGNSGEDKIYGGKGVDVMFGNDDDDSMWGGDHVDIMFGNQGDDEMRGQDGGAIASVYGVDIRFGNLMFGNLGEDEMYGGGDLDVMFGNDGDDEMYGGDGSFVLLSLNNDFMFGNDGDDEMYGRFGPDWMFGNDGEDEMYGGLGLDIMFGNQGEDSMSGGLGSDLMFGNDGEDEIRGGWGSDIIFGNQQADDIFGNLGFDIIFGNDGNDDMDGGWGWDLMFGNTGADQMKGNLGRDLMFGNSDQDEMDGGLGNDLMFGNDGNDIMQGDDGSFWAFLSNDMMFGNRGMDTMNGGRGSDLMFGNRDNDTMNGGRGLDMMFGNRGVDTMNGGRNSDLMFGNRDNDEMWGDDGQDLMFGNRGEDQMHGGDGWDLMFGNRNNDEMWGDDGQDLMFGNRGEDRMHGGNKNDLMFGNRDDDCMYGDPGNDLMFGNRGDDCMYGNAGTDLMFGNRDEDKMWGGSGTDLVFGNRGNDQIDAEADADLVFGNRGDDRINGGSGNDLVFGNRDNDCMKGGSGNDLMFGNRGNDCMDGQDGKDLMFGNRGDDVILGGNDKDRIWGNRDDDKLDGNAGNDRIRGNWGNDTLWGGPGADNLVGGFGSDTLFPNGNSGLLCNCEFVPCDLDFGDAPDSYGTYIASNGAHHGVGGPVLGSLIDAEPDGQPSAGAYLDDNNGIDDEDGVSLPSLVTGTTATATVVLSSATSAYLDGWVDFNQNGIFDSSEKIFFGTVINAGSNSLTFAVPATATPGGSHARFRVSTKGGLSPYGYGGYGEVEDYRTAILQGNDFGDAPDSYGTLLVSNGAHHSLGGPVLGSLIDVEPDGQPSIGAYLDNGTGINDEDGVSLPSLVTGTTATATVVLSSAASAYLDGWVDFDQNGVFDLAEQIFTGTVINAGSNSLTFAVPGTATPGGSHARFRVSAKGSLSPYGYGGDGEVEDYRTAILQGNDFGDAPDSYGTLLVSNGANHSLGGPVLGSLIDAEPDGQPSIGAYLDDGTGMNDEDGVSLPSLVTGTTATATVVLSSATSAYLDGWVDFDQNGIFDSSEKIFSGAVINVGSNFLTFAVPATATPGGSHARFRVSAKGGLSPYGYGGNGEVEDYRTAISQGRDFGDALDSYGTLLASNGANHSLGGPVLGSLIDAEPDGQPSVGADLDDTMGIDDEDGVSLTSLVSGTTATATVVLSSATSAYLDGWIDFDQNGIFDASEKIFSGAVINAGSNSLTFAVPATATPGGSYARFRVSAKGGLSPYGYGGDGEVEDYLIPVEQGHLDFGDALDSYGTLLASNGAHHSLGGPVLGSLIDIEPDGQPSVGADLDDTMGVDDEDGVSLTSLVSGTTATATVVLSSATSAYLDGWIDFDQNGVFDLAEQIFTGTVINAGSNSLTFVVPATATSGSTYARFRVSVQSGLSPYGYGGTGEVEDYIVPVEHGQLDFGDAPESYGTLLPNGAHHAGGGPILGSAFDSETNGQPSASANDDDLLGIDDEDGVSGSGVTIGAVATAVVVLTSSVPAYLDAWIDFDQDGVFDSSDQIFNSVVVNPGSNTLNFSVPTTAIEGATFGRFRISQTGVSSATGYGGLGEVEDYLVGITKDSGDGGNGRFSAIGTLGDADAPNEKGVGVEMEITGDRRMANAKPMATSQTSPKEFREFARENDDRVYKDILDFLFGSSLSVNSDLFIPKTQTAAMFSQGLRFGADRKAIPVNSDRITKNRNLDDNEAPTSRETIARTSAVSFFDELMASIDANQLRSEISLSDRSELTSVDDEHASELLFSDLIDELMKNGI